MDKKVIHSVFEETAKKFPSNTAVQSAEGTISYEALNEFANRVAHLLQWIGCEPEKIVTVVMPSSIELTGAMLGVFKAGAIYLPAAIDLSPKRWQQLLTETFDGIVITRNDLYEKVVEMANRFNVTINCLVVMGEAGTIKLYGNKGKELCEVTFTETNEWKTDPVLVVNGDSSNYIFYTSGSTGDGKAILGKHAGLSHFIHWEVKEFNIDATFRVSQLTAATFDASLRDVFVALITGGTVCIPSDDTKSNPAHLLSWLERSGINLVHCVPSLFRVLTRQWEIEGAEKYDVSPLKYIILAGELLYAKDINSFQKLAGDNIQLVNFYGATETTLIKTFYRINQAPENPAQVIPVGIPISNTSVAIINNERICKQNEIGELYVKTPFATKGYYNNEKLTNECFVPNPLTKDPSDIVYRTGDLGRYLKDGNIEVLGRLDSQVKVNGIRVELNEIEKAMMEHEAVGGVIVKAHRTDDNLVVLIAYYTGRETAAADLRALLEQRLNTQVIPSYFVYLEKFPLNTNGKVDKKLLPVPEDILIDELNYEAPQGIIENTLALLWKDILGLKRTGRHTSFFSVGGHSLRAIQLISRIYREFNVNIRIADIFSRRTIREQAILIEESTKDDYNVILPAEVQPAYELSSSQRRLWVLSQFATDNITYNIPAVYVFEGELHLQALEYAFNKLVSRHEVLRTIFKEDGEGNIRQYILAPAESGFGITYIDVRDKGWGEGETTAFISDQLRAPFNLELGPLMRVVVYQLEDHKWIFVFVMHHIVSDDWSMEILIREVLHFYNAGIRNEPDQLPPLRIQYKDYAAWQQRRLRNGLLEQNRKYWLQQFSGVLPILMLPGDKPRPAVKTHHGAAINLVMGAGIANSLKDTVNKQGGTLFMGLLAMINILLHKHTRQEDIIIGSPVAGREHLDTEDQLGFYINTIALRTRFKSEDTFPELFQQVKQLTLDAYENQAYPFDELVDALKMKRDGSRNTLFDVWLVLHEDEMFKGRQLPVPENLQVNIYDEELPVFSKFDLLFSFTDTAQELRLNVEYNTDIFERSSVENMCRQLENIIELVTGNGESRIDEIVNQLESAEKKGQQEHLLRTREKNLANLINNK